MKPLHRTVFGHKFYRSLQSNVGRLTSKQPLILQIGGFGPFSPDVPLAVRAYLNTKTAAEDKKRKRQEERGEKKAAQEAKAAAKAAAKAPSKARSAYTCFSNDIAVIQQLRAEHPGVNGAQLTQHKRAKWTGLDQTGRKPFQDAEAADKARYARELAQKGTAAATPAAAPRPPPAEDPAADIVKRVAGMLLAQTQNERRDIVLCEGGRMLSARVQTAAGSIIPLLVSDNAGELRHAGLRTIRSFIERGLELGWLYNGGPYKHTAWTLFSIVMMRVFVVV